MNWASIFLETCGSDEEVDNVGVKAALAMLRFYKSESFFFKLKLKLEIGAIDSSFS